MNRILRALARTALACAACAATLSFAQGDQRQTVRIGLVDNFSPRFYIQTYAPTIQYLKEKFPEYRFESVEFDGVQAIERSGETFDFVVSSSGAFAVLRLKLGLEHVVMRRRVGAPRASASVSGVMLVRADRKDLKTIRDLKGKVLATDSTRLFGGYVALLDEIGRSGYDPDSFFSGKLVTDYRYPDAVSLLSLGRADVAFLSTCRWEELIETGVVAQDALRVINDKTQAGERCARSAEGLPGEIFAATPAVSSEVAKNVTIALLQMPRGERDWEWVSATVLVPVYELLERMKLGPFAYLRERTPAVFFERYRMQIGLGLLFIVFCLGLALLRIYRSNVLIRRRTQELTQTIREKERLTQEANQTRHYLRLLERNNIVSQLSSMFAHELKQPVTNIINYAAGLKMLSDSGRSSEKETQLALAAISDQARRVGDIIERVRAYAKGQPAMVTECRLREVAEQLARDFRMGQTSKARLQISVPGDIVLPADPVALELLLLNLLRNADNALRGVRKPEIQVSAASRAGHVRITVSDNGPGVPEQFLDKLGGLGAVPNPSGLGMGLTIAAGIAEKHKGHLEFHNRPEGGFTVAVYLPGMPQQGEPDEDEKRRQAFQDAF